MTNGLQTHTPQCCFILHHSECVPLPLTVDPAPSTTGVANLFLECLHQDVRHEYDTPVIAPTGSVCGRLKLAIQKVPFVEEQEQDGSEGEAPSQKEQLAAPSRSAQSSTATELRLGTKAVILFEVIEATGLPSALCHYAFCNYFFIGQSGPVVVPEAVSVDPTARSLAETSPKFHHMKVREGRGGERDGEGGGMGREERGGMEG